MPGLLLFSPLRKDSGLSARLWTQRERVYQATHALSLFTLLMGSTPCITATAGTGDWTVLCGLKAHDASEPLQGSTLPLLLGRWFTPRCIDQDPPLLDACAPWFLTSVELRAFTLLYPS
jgi:hypothetical protein